MSENLTQIIANYLLGAPDAHAKNYSLLLAQNTASLAPLYDVASGLAVDTPSGQLRYRKNAVSIGGKNVFGEVTGREWKKFSHIAGQDEESVFSVVEGLALQLPDALRDAIAELPNNVQGREILTNRLLPRINALARHTLSTLGDLVPQKRLFGIDLSNY